MIDALGDAGATLYELELIGDVQSRVGVDDQVQRSATFSVTALWPEAAALASHQLYLAAAARLGLNVHPGVRVSRCEPTGL